MAISTNYATPVTVNGFSCRNCSDVARAEKNIDPADPAAGPFGVNGTSDGSTPKADQKTIFDRDAIDAGKPAAAHRQAAALSAFAAAYGGVGGVDTGRFVDLKG